MIISVILPIVVGFILSVYAGFISARILSFHDLRNRAAVLTSQMSYSYTKEEALVAYLGSAEEIRLAGLTILEAGHNRAGRDIELVGLELIAILREKLEWRRALSPTNINSLVYTPVFSPQKINALEATVRQSRFDVRVILSPLLWK